MLYSQGVPLQELGVAPKGAAVDGRSAPRVAHVREALSSVRRYAVVALAELRLHEGVRHRRGARRAHRRSLLRSHRRRRSSTPEFRPRALFERFRIEVIATTEGPNDPLEHHRCAPAERLERASDHDLSPRSGRRSRARAFSVPRSPSSASSRAADVYTWRGYLKAHRARREFFAREGGATATDHGHPTRAHR